MEDLIAALKRASLPDVGSDPLHLRGPRDATRDAIKNLFHHFRGGDPNRDQSTSDLAEFLKMNLRQNQMAQQAQHDQFGNAIQSAMPGINNLGDALSGFFGMNKETSPYTPKDPNTGLPFGLRSPYGATPQAGDGSVGSGESQDPIASLFEKALRQTLRGGGSGVGGVIKALQNEQGVLQDQFGQSKSDLLDHEQMATDDLGVLYGHLQNYIKRSNQQSIRDTHKNIQQVKNQYGRQIDKFSNQANRMQADNTAELERLGIAPQNVPVKLQGSGVISRAKGDRLDSIEGLREGLTQTKRMNRQMRADAMMEGNVQTGQVHRDTIGAIGDLESQLQSSLASLGTQIAQARGQKPTLAERLQSAMDLTQAYSDYQNPGGADGGAAPEVRTTNMQDALEYLSQVGGQNTPLLQSLMNTAENYGTMTNSDHVWTGGGEDPRMYHYQWSPDNIGMITRAFSRGLGAKGVPAQPNLTYLQRALEIALGGTH